MPHILLSGIPALRVKRLNFLVKNEASLLGILKPILAFSKLGLMSILEPFGPTQYILNKHVIFYALQLVPK